MCVGLNDLAAEAFKVTMGVEMVKGAVCVGIVLESKEWSEQEKTVDSICDTAAETLVGVARVIC